MKTKLILAIILLIIANTVQAQQLNLKVGGQYFTTPSKVYQQEYEGIFSRLLSISSEDTLYIRGNSHVITTYKNQYTYKGGGQVALELIWDLSPKLRLASGLGFNYKSFSAQREFINSEFVILSADTVSGPIPPGIIVIGGNCTYTNSISDLGDISDELNIGIVELNIPLAFNYVIIPDKLDISFGGNISTPLFSKVAREFFTVETEMDSNGDRLCTYVKMEESDHTGNNLRNFNVYLSSSIAFWLGKAGLELSLAKRLNNIIIDVEEQIYPFNGYSIKPIEVGLNLKYRLN